MTAFTTRPELAGTFGAVATTHWIGSAVGMKVLEAGGNAFDAAVAIAFTLQIVEPHLNGPAGDASILVARGRETAPTVICGQGGAPANATLEHFQTLGLGQIPGTGSLAPCVPGAFGAWLTLLRDWGTISLREALVPAIHYAREGHPVHFSAIETIRSVEDLFRTEWTTSAALYLPGERLPTPGDLFANARLAETYAALLEHAEQAASEREAQIEAALSYWYEGPIAEAMETFLVGTDVYDVSGHRHRGVMTAADLRGWRPRIERALGVAYRGYEVFKCGAWSQGPALLQALKMLRDDDIAALDPEGDAFVHLIAETLKLVMSDREAWLGDDPDVPLELLLSDDYAAQRRRLVSEQASLELRPGAPGGKVPVLPLIGAATADGDRGTSAGGGEPTFANLAEQAAKAKVAGIRGDTVHIDVVDRWGNLVSATPSGGWLQSNPVIPALGFPMGTRMQMFSLQPGHANSLAPGKRPRTTLTPTMVFRDGRPYLALGTPGGDQQEQWQLQMLLRHLDHDMPLQQAIDTPAFHTDHLVGSFWPKDYKPGALILESRFGEAVVAALATRGHEISLGPPWSEGRLSACATLGGVVRAAANARGMQGYAIAR